MLHTQSTLRKWQKEFVTYDIALAVEKLGFNEDCLGFYSYDKYKRFYSHDKYKRFELYESYDSVKYRYSIGIKAPLWQQMIDWFDLKQCHITINYSGHLAYEYKINYLGKQYSESLIYSTRHITYERSILKAIELCQRK